MKKKAGILKRSILSLFLCLCLVISPLADTGLEASAQVCGSARACDILLSESGYHDRTVSRSGYFDKRDVTFENGVLNVEPGAASAVVYVSESSEDGLSTEGKVDAHDLSFAFGSQDVAEGYTQVTDTPYTDELGYGFADTSSLTVNTDNVTAQNAFRFKAKVPSGNYVVQVDTTAESMTSEVVESVSAVTGITKIGSSFSVAVCDGVLDLTFPAESSVKSIVISREAAKQSHEKPYIYAIGDSTTKNTADGAKSWGNCAEENLVPLPEVFGGFVNHGKAGDDSVVYYNNARLEAVLLAICPGDYVTINMGINSREAGEGAAYETMMRDYYVNGVLQRSGIPVIVTATPDGPVSTRVSFDYDQATGRFTNNRGDGARNNILRKIASELNVDLIELGQWGEDWMNTLTEDDVADYNAAYNTDYQTVLEMVQSWYVDHNHYKEYLGKQIAQYLFSELARLAGDTPGGEEDDGNGGNGDDNNGDSDDSIKTDPEIDNSGNLPLISAIALAVIAIICVAGAVILRRKGSKENEK